MEIPKVHLVIERQFAYEDGDVFTLGLLDDGKLAVNDVVQREQVSREQAILVAGLMRNPGVLLSSEDLSREGYRPSLTNTASRKAAVLDDLAPLANAATGMLRPQAPYSPGQERKANDKRPDHAGSSLLSPYLHILRSERKLYYLLLLKPHDTSIVEAACAKLQGRGSSAYVEQLRKYGNVLMNNGLPGVNRLSPLDRSEYDGALMQNLGRMVLQTENDEVIPPKNKKYKIPSSIVVAQPYPDIDKMKNNPHKEKQLLAMMWDSFERVNEAFANLGRSEVRHLSDAAQAYRDRAKDIVHQPGPSYQTWGAIEAVTFGILLFEASRSMPLEELCARIRQRTGLKNGLPYTDESGASTDQLPRAVIYTFSQAVRKKDRYINERYVMKYTFVRGKQEMQIVKLQ